MPAEKRPRIAILGWGSLLWDSQADGARSFDEQRNGDWDETGPELPIEFCRVSDKRRGALTLIIDPIGTPTTVAWCLSKRSTIEDAACDLRSREGTVAANIARVDAQGIYPAESDHATVAAWAKLKGLDAVVWTALPNNFQEKTKSPFSVDAAVAWVRDRLSKEGKAKAAEYVWCAPSFVDTPVRRRLQAEPWFKTPGALGA